MISKKFVTLLMLCGILTAAIPAVANAETVVLNPSTLRTRLMEGNTAISIELNAVHQAKDSLNISRARLLPSLNVGAILGSAANPSFMVSSVSFLLPFLLPSNWFELGVSEHLLDAQKDAYYLLELNQYASAYALYTTVVADLEIRDVLEQQYENLQNIHDILQAQNDALGMNPRDLNEALAQAQLAKVQVLQMDEILSQEKAAVRFALGLALNDELQFEAVHVGASIYESNELQKVSDLAFSIAPENTQLKNLIAAAVDAKWAQVFGFANGASLNATSSNGSTFGGITANGSISFGPSYFPALTLSNDNRKQIELQQKQLKFQESQIVESNIKAIASAKDQLDLSTQAEETLTEDYQIERQKYDLGITDFLHLLTAQNQVTTAAAMRIKNQLDLDNLRINLHRVLLSEQFASIHGCNLDVKALKSAHGSNPLDWLFGGRSNKNAKVDIDKVCRAK